MSRSKESLAFGLSLVLASALTEADAQQPIRTDLRPRVVRRAEGERRYLADGRFMLLKVGPVATGASYLFMGYEDLPPGTAIPQHRHEVDEEILIVYRGRVRVLLDRDTASIFFVFPRGSVERCFQFVGRGEGEPPRDRSRGPTVLRARASAR